MRKHAKSISQWCILVCLLILTACGGDAQNQANENPQTSMNENLPAAVVSNTGTGDEPETIDNENNMDPQTETENVSSHAESEPEPPSETSEQSTEPIESNPNDQQTDEPAGEVHVVEIVNFAFSPVELEIKVGDSVKFVNKDAVKHTATADDESFDTGLMGQDVEIVVQFDKAGDYGYYCRPHPGMRGQIKVTN